MKIADVYYIEGFWAGYGCRCPYSNNPYFPIDPRHNDWSRGWQDGRFKLNQEIEEESKCHS